MHSRDVIIIGGGPAGMAAAKALAEAGIACTIVEQRATLGGAIHRQPIPGADHGSISGAAARRWKSLVDGVASPFVDIIFATTFFGIDGEGYVLLQNRNDQTVTRVTAQAIIVATGAVERIQPIPGWELPGVSTAGGMQVMLKETGVPPRGRVVLAGSGPLLIALAAQLAKAGNPPVAVVEAGDPLLQPMQGLGLLAQPSVLVEAVSYTAAMLLSKTRWLRSSYVERIEATNGSISLVVARKNGSREMLTADRIALHNGITENDVGLPEWNESGSPLIIRAGDCREALGVLAAVADGTRAARTVITKLQRLPPPSVDRSHEEFERAVRTQRCISRLFSAGKSLPSAALMPDDTILCRCEGRTLGDLKALASQPGISGREVKHNGRFAMGSCQGRFCAANTAALMAELQPEQPTPSKSDLTGRRWPIRPISIASLTTASFENNNENEVQ